MTDEEALAEVLEFLPHRKPFLFADRVDIDEKRIIGFRRFLPDEAFFAGHFPAIPSCPASSSSSRCSNAAAWACARWDRGRGHLLLAKVKEARFRRQGEAG